MPRLIFDIETVGEDFDGLDQTTQDVLTRWIRRASDGEESYRAALANLKEELGFSPFTGHIAAIGVLDYEKGRGAVYYLHPGADAPEAFREGEIEYKPMDEKTMLEKFWSGVKSYREFVSFNGRCFDVPFLMIRSAIHEVRPSKDLLSNRYLNSQRFDGKHIDLMDQFSFYGALRRKPSLHLACRAFGIQSPKTQGVTGDDVKRLFTEGKYLDIARYNADDLRATKALYEYWEKYLKF
jgi:uncharacterized protein YprB with RNaseH-like and TPR domain